MKIGLNKQLGINRRGIVWLLLFVFSSFLLAEITHTHKPFHEQQFSVSSSPDGAVVKHPQSFCKFCDYLLHQAHSLAPTGYHFLAAPVKAVYTCKCVVVKLVYKFDDLSFFSGNSPPLFS